MRETTALTARQSEVIALVARGLTNREIADQLGLSLDGVKAHISRLLLRFAVSNRVELLNATQGWESADSRAFAALAAGSGTIAAAGQRRDGDIRHLRESGGAMLESWRRISADARLSTGASPAVTSAVDELRRALEDMSAALEAAKDLPPDTATGRLLVSVRRRLHAAVSASEALGGAITETDGRVPARRQHRGPARRRMTHR